MQQLKEIIENTPLNVVAGTIDKTIDRLVFDSRQAGPRTLFVAVPGTQVDGHAYIDAAIDAGTDVVVCQTLPDTLRAGVTYLQTENSALVLAILADRFYGQPSRQLQLIGITGTNGKTSVATLLHQLFTGLGYRAGLLSTVENRIGEQVVVATHTTPDSVALNALLREMVDAGCDYVFMEVSSHAVHQFRTAGLAFAGGVFTNMSHDHLDYHGTFKAYIGAKKMFFDTLDPKAFALVNVDDKRGEVMVQNTAARIYRYSLRSLVDFRARIFDNAPEGLHLEINGHELYARMIGDFNAYNLLAAYGVATLLDQDTLEVLAVLSDLRGAAGRLEHVTESRLRLVGIVDYAHTPDALEKVLKTLRSMQRDRGRIFTVVGAGGDRDRTKRPKMARIAATLSDQVILTSDNPRTETPGAILNEMETGLTPELRPHTLRIEDRTSAIRTAVRLARPGDVILVAGKGHEKYQEINGKRHPFDDKVVLEQAFAELVYAQN